MEEFKKSIIIDKIRLKEINQLGYQFKLFIGYVMYLNSINNVIKINDIYDVVNKLTYKFSYNIIKIEKESIILDFNCIINDLNTSKDIEIKNLPLLFIHLIYYNNVGFICEQLGDQYLNTEKFPTLDQLFSDLSNLSAKILQKSSNILRKIKNTLNDLNRVKIAEIIHSDDMYNMPYDRKVDMVYEKRWGNMYELASILDEGIGLTYGEFVNLIYYKIIGFRDLKNSNYKNIENNFYNDIYYTNINYFIYSPIIKEFEDFRNLKVNILGGDEFVISDLYNYLTTGIYFLEFYTLILYQHRLEILKIIEYFKINNDSPVSIFIKNKMKDFEEVYLRNTILKDRWKYFGIYLNSFSMGIISVKFIESNETIGDIVNISIELGNISDIINQRNENIPYIHKNIDINFKIPLDNLPILESFLKIIKDYFQYIFTSYPLHPELISSADFLYYNNIYNYFPELRNLNIPLMEKMKYFFQYYIEEPYYREKIFKKYSYRLSDLQGMESTFELFRNTMLDQSEKLDKYLFYTNHFRSYLGLEFGLIKENTIDSKEKLEFENRFLKYDTKTISALQYVSKGIEFYDILQKYLEELPKLFKYLIENDYILDIGFYIHNLIRINHQLNKNETNEKKIWESYKTILRVMKASIYDSSYSKKFYLFYPIAIVLIPENIRQYFDTNKTSSNHYLKFFLYNFIFIEKTKDTTTIMKKLNADIILNEEFIIIKEFLKGFNMANQIDQIIIDSKLTTILEFIEAKTPTEIPVFFEKLKRVNITIFDNVDYNPDGLGKLKLYGKHDIFEHDYLLW